MATVKVTVCLCLGSTEMKTLYSYSLTIHCMKLVRKQVHKHSIDLVAIVRARSGSCSLSLPRLKSSFNVVDVHYVVKVKF